MPGARRGPERVSNGATPLRLALVALLAVTGCPDKKAPPPAGPPPSPETQFWTWFDFEQGHLAERASSGGKQAVSTMLEITKQLESVNPGFKAELQVGDPGQPHTLVLTVNGDTRLFPAVQRFAATAPPLKQWKVVAFRQRKALPPMLKFGEYGVNQEDVRFKETGRANGKLDIEVHVKGLTPQNERAMDQAVFVFIDHAIGEYDTETKLGAIDIKAAAVATDDTLKPLTALAALVDGLGDAGR